MYTVDKSFILNTSVPTQTRTYKPISHGQLIDLSLNSLNEAGFQLEKSIYSSSNEGKQATGRYIISNIADSDMKLMMGWQNSYDKKLSLKFAIGASIIICENGSCKGDIGYFKKKHMGEVQEFTPKNIPEFIKKAQDIFEEMQKEKERLKQIEISKRIQGELLGRMFIDDAIITSTQLNIIKREIENPSYNYNIPGSAWELYNHCTHALKEDHPAYYFSRHKDVYNFFENNI